VRKFFSSSLRRIPLKVTTQAELKIGKLRRVDAFGHYGDDSLAHTDGCAKLEEEIRFMETVWLNKRHEHIVMKICGLSILRQVDSSSSNLRALTVEYPVQLPPRLPHPRPGMREEVFVDGDGDDLRGTGAGE
jgi:hypothetical protein